MESSLKETVMKDIYVLDEHFNKCDNPDEKIRWGNVREAAIAFLDVFEKIKKINRE